MHDHQFYNLIYKFGISDKAKVKAAEASDEILVRGASVRSPYSIEVNDSIK